MNKSVTFYLFSIFKLLEFCYIPTKYVTSAALCFLNVDMSFQTTFGPEKKIIAVAFYVHVN